MTTLPSPRVAVPVSPRTNASLAPEPLREEQEPIENTTVVLMTSNHTCMYLSAKTSCPEAMVSWAAPAQPPLLLSPPSPMHGSAFPLLYWPKFNHAVRGFVSYLPLLLPGLMGLMKVCYNPFSCHFSGRSFGFSSTPARREGEVLLGLGLVKLLSLTVRQATCLTLNPTTFT